MIKVGKDCLRVGLRGQERPFAVFQCPGPFGLPEVIMNREMMRRGTEISNMKYSFCGGQGKAGQKFCLFEIFLFV